MPDTVAVVIVTGWRRPPESRSIDRVTVHESRPAADGWAEDQIEIGRHGYEVHEREVVGE